jgi:hypothetical protein
MGGRVSAPGLTDSLGAKLGANADRVRATRGDTSRLLLQVSTMSGDDERRLAGLGSAS